MKKINSLSLILFLWLIVSITACFDEPGTSILLSESFIEINEATTSGGLEVSKSYNRLNDGTTFIDSIRINLVGPHRSTPITVNFQIDATSTAIEGLHYNKLTTGTSVTIPANSSFGYFEFEVLPDNIDAGEVWSLKFILTGTDASDIKLSENYKSLTHSMRILCPFVRNNFLGNYDCDEPGYAVYDVTLSTDADPNTIVSNNFWDVGASVKYTFNPANGTLQIQQTTFMANIGAGSEALTVQSNGTGTYDACERSFIVPYKVTRDVNGSTIDTNTHTFTPK